MSGYEKRDINIKKTVLFGIGTVLLIAFFFVVLNEYFISVKEEIIYESVLKPESISLEELATFEDSVLTTYELIDTARGIYRIPIEKAVELTVSEAALSK